MFFFFKKSKNDKLRYNFASGSLNLTLLEYKHFVEFAKLIKKNEMWFDIRRCIANIGFKNRFFGGQVKKKV